MPVASPRIAFRRTPAYFFLIVLALTVAAVKFVRVEDQMGGQTFFGLAAWLIQLVIPVTFGIMTIRYAFLSITEILKTIHVGLSRNDE